MTERFSVEGRYEIPVIARPNRRSKRITLRKDARHGGFYVSYPIGVAHGKVQRFVDQQTEWIHAHYQPKYQLNEGSVLPFRGADVRLVSTAERGAKIVDGELHVGGTQLARSAKGFLRTEAQLFAAPRVATYAERMNVTISALRWRDTSSRWGSCDRNGVIMLSWRLIMAPDDIFDYVIAHEVAHRLHMDHSAAYWASLGKYYPNYQTARQWLRANGQKIQSIVFE